MSAPMSERRLTEIEARTNELANIGERAPGETIHVRYRDAVGVAFDPRLSDIARMARADVPDLIAEVRRLRARTHELQERHDQELSAMRKQFARAERSAAHWRAIWWQRALPPTGSMDEIRAEAGRIQPIAERITPLLDRALRGEDGDELFRVLLEAGE